MESTVRVRFAPSPTGSLHVGGARTAIFNYFFARHHRGTFILRIEDTDRERFAPRARDEIFQSLSWLGLAIDEGPHQTGACGPYIQSERMDHYRTAIGRLLENGQAYRCFCTRERLEQLRKQQKQNRDTTLGYDGRCRHLSADTIEGKLTAQTPHVVRLKVPPQGEVSFHDLIRGTITYQCRELDDIILLKSDGYPTYHLANVVDDHLMQISHVMRGEEWISSTPKHILLYRALGHPLPKFAHLPVILSSGGGKLSKRKGASSVMEYREQGFLPEALVNFLSLLGWSPGDDTEIMDSEEITRRFSLDRITAKASVFDEQKLIWINGHYLRQRSTASIIPLVKELLVSRNLPGKTGEDRYLEKVIHLLKDRSKTLVEIAESSGYFFEDPSIYDPKTARKRFKKESAGLLRDLHHQLQELEEFTAGAIEELYRQAAQKAGLSAGKLIHPTRLAVSGVGYGPGLFEMMELLGREAVLRRMDKAVRWIENKGEQDHDQNKG